MTILEDLYADREHERVVLLAQQRKLARQIEAVDTLDPTTFQYEREYREQMHTLERDRDETVDLIARLEANLADYADVILEAWDDERKVKPTTIPQPWGGA